MKMKWNPFRLKERSGGILVDLGNDAAEKVSLKIHWERSF